MNTFRITPRTLSDGLVGIVLTGFRDGVVATRTNAAVVQASRLDSYVAEMRASLTAKGLVDGDALVAIPRPRPTIAFA
jgi:hypothetical protein